MGEARKKATDVATATEGDTSTAGDTSMAGDTSTAGDGGRHRREVEVEVIWAACRVEALWCAWLAVGTASKA